MKIAIVGAGISGLGAAYLLAQRHDVVVYEKNDYAGGHSRTITVRGDLRRTPVDTGFIVFNDRNYPHLMGLFKTLDVPFEKSDMSFGVSIDDGWLEYASGNIMAQKRNLLRPAFWRMIADVIRFNKRAPAYLERNDPITLGECLDELGLSEWFRRYYVLAMGASIWSCPIDTIMQFPASTFLHFFKNHGLLSLGDRPQWYTVTGGSREYVRRLTQGLGDRVQLNSAATRVATMADGQVCVVDSAGQEAVFDRVILACHADEAMTILETPTPEQKAVIGAFRYQENSVVLHGDATFMPKRRACWASWVYLSEKRIDDGPAVSLSYWMNRLQNLKTDLPLIVTLNPGREPDPALVHDRHVFSHPIFDRAAIEAQKRIGSIQGQNNIWFCGAYQRYGFHEDGLLSAVNVARAFEAPIPWEA